MKMVKIPIPENEPSKRPSEETKHELHHMQSMADISPARRSIIQFESTIDDLKKTITALKDNIRDLRKFNQKTEFDKKKLEREFISERDKSKIVFAQRTEIIELRATNICIGVFTGLGGGLISSFPKAPSGDNIWFFIGWIFLALAVLSSLIKEAVCFFIKKSQK